MRMNAKKMKMIESNHPKMSITQLVKKFVDNENYCYSFKENKKTMRMAIIRAIKWSKNRRFDSIKKGVA